MVRAIDDFDLPSPFGELGAPTSDSELRETAYEILIGSCRSSGTKKPLTFISQSEKLSDKSSSSSSLLSSTAASGSLQRSLTSAAASKVKKALGLKRSSSPKASEVGDGERNKGRRTATVGELIRVQMRVSEQTDSRVRRALLRVAAGQLGRRMDSIVLPLELLQQFKPSDFADEQEYESWQRRNLKMLELGLLLHPQVPVSRSDAASAQQLRQIIHTARERPIQTGKNSESVQALRTAVMSLAYRSFDGSAAETCHWADGFPLNLHLYQMLLEACFELNDQTAVIEDIDELLELIKKTWIVLGINQMLHNICFTWVLFHHYVESGQLENDLLFAASTLLTEIERDSVPNTDPEYIKLLRSTLTAMLGWAEKRLLTYHDTFNSGSSDLMQSVASIAVNAAKILEDISHEHKKKRKEVGFARGRVDSYIRSSVRCAFAQKMEKVNLIKRSARNQRDSIPLLCVLAQEVTELAVNEKEVYSPILKAWHPLAAGAAVATLHKCYGNELKQFVSGISELTPDAVQVLISADKLEKQVVQIAVDDAVESEDGGKDIIKEMPPYEAESLIATLVKSWITTRVDRMKEWVDRCMQHEVWNLQANKEQVAPSAIDVLRTIDEYLEAFFLLPIPIEGALVADLMAGLDSCLQQYIMKAISGCGTRNTYIPSIPALTRCSARSKFFKKRDKSQLALRRSSQVGSMKGDDPFGIPQLCVRINTIQYLRSGANYLEKKTVTYMKKSGSTEVESFMNASGMKFELSVSACSEAVQQLCESAAYKIIFHELSQVLWDALYAGEVCSSRIEPFLLDLDRYLGIIATSVNDRVRTRVITEVMKASFEGFLLVLLAGGPSRAFARQDSSIIEEDFKLLCDLFWSNGDGLPTDVIDRFSSTAKSVLPLLGRETEALIDQFRQANADSNSDSSAKSRLPAMAAHWGPTDPNTLLRVLCHRNDEVAAKFLKKTCPMPDFLILVSVQQSLEVLEHPVFSGVKLTYSTVLCTEASQAKEMETNLEANPSESHTAVYIIGNPMDFPKIFAKLRIDWRYIKGEFRFSDLKCGWFEIILSNPLDLKKIWENRPYHISGQLLLLKQWYVGLPTEYANYDALSAILELNNFGTMIRLDPIHSKRKWMTFTRLCVNTDVQFSTGRKIVIPDENMCEKKYNVWFDDFPIGCGAPGELGHEFDSCTDRVAIPPKLKITLMKPSSKSQPKEPYGSSSSAGEWVKVGASTESHRKTPPQPSRPQTIPS
ncbi:hypothetical protein V2J09_017778 [Rumex salicifolius]